MDSMTRGELAKRCGVNFETVRYYEQRGLIPRPTRSSSNYRLYGEDAVRRIRFIQRAHELGFTLKQTGELLALRAAPPARCDQVYRRAEEKVRDIEARVRALQGMRRALSKLMKECRSSGKVSECPILEALEDEEA